MLRPTRRGVLLATGGAFIAVGVGVTHACHPPRDRIGEPLSPWRSGDMDIHVLSTGRGDATLIVTPDGRTLLVDVGAAGGDPTKMLPARPNADRSPGLQVAAYARRRIKETGRSGVDVVYATHLHDDHVAGMADLADDLDIGKLIDPDYPDYGYPPFEGREVIARYVDFVRTRVAAGGFVERLRVGRDDQFGLDPVRVRALASRGVVWTGLGMETRVVFPPKANLAPADYPNENAAGSAIFLQFGAFRVFFGGDLTDWADAGARPWLDVLTPAARAAGPVDVALAPHHGLFDASGADFVQALRPKHWVVSAWHQSHGSPSTLARLLERRLNPRLDGLYLTGISTEAAVLSERRLINVQSRSGHVIVRVTEGGRYYQIVTTDDSSDDDMVRSVSEPFATT